jgi:hypothetical protein
VGGEWARIVLSPRRGPDEVAQGGNVAFRELCTRQLRTAAAIGIPIIPGRASRNPLELPRLLRKVFGAMQGGGAVLGLPVQPRAAHLQAV